MSFLDISLILDAPALRRNRDLLVRLHLKAVKDALVEIVREAERALEEKTREAAPGNLWRAWTSGYGPGAGRLANEPAGWIRLNSYREKAGRLSRTYGAIEALTQTGRIAARSGGWLAIPLPAAGSRGKSRWLTPGEWERQTGQRLRYVYRGNKPALLVADEGTTNARSGAFRAITRKRTAADQRRGFVRGAQTVPIFVLVPFVATKAKFSIEAVVNSYRAALPRRAIQKLSAIGESVG